MMHAEKQEVCVIEKLGVACRDWASIIIRFCILTHYLKNNIEINIASAVVCYAVSRGCYVVLGIVLSCIRNEL